MSTKPLLLEGKVQEQRTDELDVLRDRVSDLESEVASLQIQLRSISQETGKTIARLLSPLYKALKPVYGEIDSVEELGVSSVPARTKAVWDNWKQKLGGSAAKIIDALLLHGEMNTQQLSIAVGLHRTTIPALIYKLNQAGLINKNGGRFSLKEL